MRILVTGAAGQVGARVVSALGGHDVLAATHALLDVADRERVEQVVGEFHPEAVVNAAAMTSVDACELDPDTALAINALGVRNLAIAADRVGAHIVHISTDYVFDGASTRLYDEWDAVNPLSEYGRSKFGGETELQHHARSWTIARTSWVFGRRGTDLISWAFGEYDRGELDRVLADQVSIPTYAPDLAAVLARFAVEHRSGLFHVTSGSEAVTRHELVATALRARGLDPSGIAAAHATDLDRPARRPVMSGMDNRALRLAGLPGLRSWRDALSDYVKGWNEVSGPERSDESGKA